MQRVGMFLLALSSFHPIELEATAKAHRQNLARARLDPNAPAHAIPVISHNIDIVEMIRGMQTQMSDMEMRMERAQAKSSGLILPGGGRPS